MSSPKPPVTPVTPVTPVAPVPAPGAAVKPGAFDYETYAQRNLGRYAAPDGRTLNYRAMNAEVYRGANGDNAVPITMPTLAESTSYAKALAKEDKQEFDEKAHQRQYATILKGYQQYQRGQFNSRNTAFYVENNLYNQARYGRSGTAENDDRTRQHLGEGIDTRHGGGIGDDRSEADLKRGAIGQHDFESGSYVKLGSEKNYAKDNFRQSGTLAQALPGGQGLENVQTDAKNGQVKGQFASHDYFNQPENNDKLYRTTVDDEGHYRIERQRPGENPYAFQGAQGFGSFLGMDTLSEQYQDSDLAGIPRALAQLPQHVGSGLGNSFSWLERKTGQGLQNAGATEAGASLKEHAKKTYARAQGIGSTQNTDQEGSAFSSLPALSSSISQGVGSYMQIALLGGAGTAGLTAQAAGVLGKGGMALMATGAAQQGYAQFMQSKAYTENEADMFGAAMGLATIASEKLFNTRMLRSLAGTVAGKQLTQSLLRGEETVLIKALADEGKSLGRKLTAKETADLVQRRFVPGAIERMAGKISAWKTAYNDAGGYEKIVLDKLPRALRPVMEFGEAFEEFGEQGMNDLTQDGFAKFVFDGQVYKALDFMPESLRPVVEQRDEQARKAMENGTSAAAYKSAEQIFAGAWQSATGGYVTGAVLSTLQHFRAAQQDSREAVQSDAIAREMVRTSGKGSADLFKNIDRMEKAGQFGVGLKADGSVPAEGEPTVNNLIAQSLRNKVQVYQNLYQQLGLKTLQQQGGEEGDKHALALLGKYGNAQELALEGLRSGVAVDSQRRVIDNLISGRSNANAEGNAGTGDNNDDDSLPAGAQPDANAADGAGTPGSDQDATDLLTFTSSEQYQQDFARRQAALKGNLQQAQDQNDQPAQDAASAELKTLAEEATRGEDPGVVGVLTKHPATRDYYEAQQQVRKLQDKRNGAATQEEETALSQQIFEAQAQARQFKNAAEQSVLDNPAGGRLVQLADAQLRMEELQGQREQVFSGHLLAAHVTRNALAQYVDGLKADAQANPWQQYWAAALDEALTTGGGTPLEKMQQLTRWQRQQQASQPAQEQERARQAFAQAEQATESLQELARQLPEALLADETGLNALVTQAEALADNSASLAAPDAPAAQALTTVLTAQAQRLAGEARAALTSAQLALAEPLVATKEQELAEATQQLTAASAEATTSAEDLEHLTGAVQQATMELDDARASARAQQVHPLASRLERAAAKLSALPVRQAADAAATPEAALAVQFYGGLHDAVAQPGALQAAVTDWLQAQPDELSTRKASALSRLEQQAALNRLHLELRAQDAPALHQAGALPAGVAQTMLTPITPEAYAAADLALRKLEQDLRTVRDRFAAASNSRFGRDNEAYNDNLQARHDHLRRLTDIARMADPLTAPELDALDEGFAGLNTPIQAAATALLSGDTAAAVAALTAAEEQLRALLAGNAVAASALHDALLTSLPDADSRFPPNRQALARYQAGSNYNESSYAGLFTYLSTVLGVSPAQWATAYGQVATELIGTNPALPGLLPSLEQQDVVQAINGFLAGGAEASLQGSNAVLDQEAQQQLTPTVAVRAARHVLYVPGVAGSGKTKMVIRVAMLVQAALGQKTSAVPLRIVATAPHARQRQTLAAQLQGANLAAESLGLDQIVASLRDGSFAGDVLVADEVTVYSDEQTQALLKALAFYNHNRTQAGQSPVRLIALGDPAQLAGRDGQGRRSRSQYFTDPLNRLCLSTRPLGQVYRTGIITAYQLFDQQRQRILSTDPVQNANISPVAGMRFSQAGDDKTTLRGVTYQTAQAQRQEAADLIEQLQANGPGETRTVRVVVSSQLVESETAELRKLGVVDAGQYVLASEDLPGQGGIVSDVEQAQGGEFDFVFVVAQEQYAVDQAGTVAEDNVNTVRAQFVGASRLRQYASIRYDIGQNGGREYNNQQVAELEAFDPESPAATTQRNAQKQELLKAAGGITTAPIVPPVPPVLPPTAPLLTGTGPFTVEKKSWEGMDFDFSSLTVRNAKGQTVFAVQEDGSGRNPADARRDLSAALAASDLNEDEKQQILVDAGFAPTPQAVHELLADLSTLAPLTDLSELTAALAQPTPAFGWDLVSLLQREQESVEKLTAALTDLATRAEAKNPLVLVQGQLLRKQLQAKAAAVENLGEALRVARVQLLTVPGDVLVLSPGSRTFAVRDNEANRAALAASGLGGIAILATADAGSTVVVEYPSDRTDDVAVKAVPPLPLEGLSEQDVADYLLVADFIRQQAQRIRELRALPPRTPVVVPPAATALPPLATKGYFDTQGLLLEGRVKLMGFAVDSRQASDPVTGPRYLQANQALQARLASLLSQTNNTGAGGNGNLNAADMEGLAAPQGGEFTGQGGSFRLVHHPGYQAFGQVPGHIGYSQNIFVIEYVEGVGADGVPARRIELGSVYKDGLEAQPGHLEKQGAALPPFAAALETLSRQPGSALPLGTSLPLERVRYSYFNNLSGSNQTVLGTDGRALSSTRANSEEPLPHEELQQALAARGIAVSSPWVITVTADQDVKLGAAPWSSQTYTNGQGTTSLSLSGSPVLFYQRAGTSTISAAQIDGLVQDALNWAATPGRPQTPTAVVKRLFDEHGLEMVMATTQAFELELYHYQDALHPGQPRFDEQSNSRQLDERLRSQLTKDDAGQPLLERRSQKEEAFTSDDWALRQMMFSSDQLEALSTRQSEPEQRRGLRNKILRLVVASDVARRQGGDWHTTALTAKLSPAQKRHFKALLEALQTKQFTPDGSDAWEANTDAWLGDLFTYLNYLDVHTGGALTAAWQEDSRLTGNTIELRLYGGSKERHTVPFSKVQQPAGVPVGSLVGASRLTMTGMSPLVNLAQAVQNGQAMPTYKPEAAPAPDPAPDAAPDAASDTAPGTGADATTPPTEATPVGAGVDAMDIDLNLFSRNISRLTQGDAAPAEAEARLRYLFGDAVEFALNRGVSFLRELGLMSGNLISLATDNGRADGRVNLATASHEALHRVLRIVSPAYRAKVLDAHRQVLAGEPNPTATAAQLRDDDYVEEQLARYYELADVRAQAEASGVKFRANPVVKFLQATAPGRIVLRALQAFNNAANRLKAEPDYLAELFTDMEKGYYRERAVRQRYTEEKAYSLNNDSPQGRRQRNFDGLAEAFGGFDVLHHVAGAVRQQVYEGMHTFDPTRLRRTYAEARLAYINGISQAAGQVRAAYANDPAGLPGPAELDNHRAQRGRLLTLLQTRTVEGPRDPETGERGTIEKTVLDLLLEQAFPMFGEGATQGVDAEREAGGEIAAQTGGEGTAESSAREQAAISASQDGTGIPLWEKDREAREGATLQLHLNATPLYGVQFEIDPATGESVPVLTRDAQNRYVDAHQVQSILDGVFAGAFASAVLEGRTLPSLTDIRQSLRHAINHQFGDTQSTAASLYVKFFNGQPSLAYKPGEDGPVSVRDAATGQDRTPVSFFEVLNPGRAVNAQVGKATPEILASYEQEYQKVISALISHYQSARNAVAVDYNILEGSKTTGQENSSLHAATAVGNKATSQASLAQNFFAVSADGGIRPKAAPLAALARAGFSFGAGPLVGNAPTTLLLHRGQPFLQWQVSRKNEVEGQLVSKLPIREQAAAYAQLLQAAGLDFSAELLSQTMRDARGSSAKESVLGFDGINHKLQSVATHIWSQALAMHLNEQLAGSPEAAAEARAHPAAAVVLHPLVQTRNQEDVRRYGSNPDGPAQLLRSPLLNYQSLLSLQKTLAQWAKNGQQSSVKTAEGDSKHLRRFSPSLFMRLRGLQVTARDFARTLTDVQGIGQPRSLAERFAAVTDRGLGWMGTAAGQPVQWANQVLSGAIAVVGTRDLNVLEHPITGKRRSIVKASKGELHDVAVYSYWHEYSGTKGGQVSLFNPTKSDKTTQFSRLVKAGVDSLSGQSGRLLYRHDEPLTALTALRELHGSYLAQFYGAIVPRWETYGFQKPAGFENLPVAEAIAVLEAYAGKQPAAALLKSALRQGVDYYGKGGISPTLKAVLAQSAEQYAQQAYASVSHEARQMIAQGMRGVPTLVWKPLRAAQSMRPYDKVNFKAEGRTQEEPLLGKDGSVHPLLLDYLLSHRILAQHIDTSLSGHHIYYPKGPGDMVKRGVFDHTAYEMPDVTNPRGLPRYGRVLVIDDTTMAGSHGATNHAGSLMATLRGLGKSEAEITDLLAKTVNQDGLGFINPLEWRLLRESEGHKYPLREQIKRIQGGLDASGTPFMFKNSDLTISNQVLLLGSPTSWNMLAQSLGGYGSPLYQRWLDLRQGMSTEQLLREEDWELLHQEYIASRAHGERIDPASIFAHHIGRIVLASGNKIAPHSIQDVNDPLAHRGTFEVDNALGGRVLSLYQNPDMASATIANITQENHMLVGGGNNYQAMHRIYDFLGQLASKDLNKLRTDVQAAAERDGKNGRTFFYEQAVESLTALGRIDNSLSLLRYGADENVPLITRQIAGAIASAINQSQKQRMSGLRATVSTMTGLVPMYNVQWADAAGVAHSERLTQQQVVKLGLAELSDGRTGPAVLVWQDGLEHPGTDLAFTRLRRRGADGSTQEASAAETEHFIRLAQRAQEQGAGPASEELEALIAANGYELAGQEILVPRETASKFGLRAGDDVPDVNRQGAAYFLEQNGGDARKAAEAWANWQEFLRPKSTRVPDTGMNSTQMSQIVGLIEGHGNTVFVPSEGEVIAGFDNDGDQTTLEFLETLRGGSNPQSGTPGQIRQELFRQKTGVFGDVRNLAQLLKPLGIDDMKAAARRADAEQVAEQKAQFGSTQGFHAHSVNIDNWKNAQDGKSGIGPPVKVREVYNNLYAVARKFAEDARLNQFAVPSYFNGRVFASITDSLFRVMDSFEQHSNSATDNAKENILGPLNINDVTVSAWTAAELLGWTIEEAASVLNHPAARAIVQQVQTGSSVYVNAKDELRLNTELLKLVQGYNPRLIEVLNYGQDRNGEDTSWNKSRQELISEAVTKLTEKHAKENAPSAEPSDQQTIEHLFLLAVKGDDLLLIQQVLAPMNGVESDDADSESRLVRLAETLGVHDPKTGTAQTAELNLGKLLSGDPDFKGRKESTNTVMDPLDVLRANAFAFSGVRAMIYDARVRRQGQIVRQPGVQARFFGKFRTLAAEARSRINHTKLSGALDQLLDAQFLSKLRTVPVPAGILAQETDPLLAEALEQLHAVDLTTAVGRHVFVEQLSTLLFQLKTRGRSEPELFGGLGASVLIQELKIESFPNGFGYQAQLARATEMSAEVKNFLEREFGKLSQLSPSHGPYLQQALVVYQLLNQGLVMGRGSLAQVFSPAALAEHNEARRQDKDRALANKLYFGADSLQQVLVRNSGLVALVQPVTDSRGPEELEAEAMYVNESGMDDEEANAYFAEQAARNQTEDTDLYQAASARLPAILGSSRVEEGLDRAARKLLKKGELVFVRLRNKATRGGVLYRSEDVKGKDKDGKPFEETQWIRQFPVGNPELNLYGTPLLSPFPVYQASSPGESLSWKDNPNLAEHLRNVRTYIQANKLGDYVRGRSGQRIMDQYGREVAADVRKFCD